MAVCANPRRRAVRLSALLAAGLVGVASTVSGAPAAQAATPPAPAPSPLAAAGFSPAAAAVAVNSVTAESVHRTDAVRLLAEQHTRAALADRLANELGSRSAGAYLNPHTGTVVVNVTDRAAAARVRAAGAVPKTVTHSSTELASLVTKLNRTVRVPNTAWTIDPTANAVVVTVSDLVAGTDRVRVLGAVAKLGGAVRVERVAGAFRPLIAGGDEIAASSGILCSAGFNVQRGGVNHVVTAGHCTRGLPTWRNLGPSTNSNFPGSDFGLIRNTSATPVPAVNLYNGSTQPIRSASGGTVGERVCKSGRTTRVTCGTISGLNATVNYGEGPVYGLIQTNVQAAPGDSGGALFDGATGLGMTSGGGGGQTYFQPLPPALSTYGATLLGGGGSPPPPPGGCAGLPAWDPATAYSPGDRVSHNGHRWEATWYSAGAAPGDPTSWAVWKDLGGC